MSSPNAPDDAEDDDDAEPMLRVAFVHPIPFSFSWSPVMQQIIAIGDKCAKNVKVQTAVWKLVREITLMHPYRLQV